MRPDLADDPGPHARAVDPLGQVAHHLVRDPVGLGAVEPLVVVGLAVPAAAQDDLQAAALGDRLDRQRVLGQASVGGVHQRPPARLGV